jgi:hypothetical protein
MASLQKDSVVETWGHLIPKQAGRSKDVYKMIREHIKSVIGKAGRGPWNSIDVEFKSVSGMGGLAGFMGEKRDRLIVSWQDYKIYVCSRPYGTDLDISWSMTFEPGFMKKVTGVDLASYNAFQVEDLRAFAALVHQAVTKAMDTVMQEAGLDPEKVNKTSKGFLGIS